MVTNPEPESGSNAENKLKSITFPPSFWWREDGENLFCVVLSVLDDCTWGCDQIKWETKNAFVLLFRQMDSGSHDWEKVYALFLQSFHVTASNYFSIDIWSEKAKSLSK